MRNLVLLLVFLLVAGIASAQSAFTGNWKGKIAAFDLTIVFNITEKDNRLTATMDSPDQGARGIHCDQVVVSGNNITISVSVVGGNYTGTLSTDKQLVDGKWNQNGGSFDLLLGKDHIPATKAKPQTPVPPFDYAVEEVEYDNADKTVHLGATLTHPRNGTNFPVAILITGSGQQDRDETLAGHKPFAVIADRLTKAGFAVLRVDDRGMGKSTGEVNNATSADFAKDVITSIEYLKRRKDIDQQRIGLIGHSEGGLIAAMVAAQRKDINFMVLLAGPGIKGADLLEEQGMKIILSSGLSKEAADAYRPFYRAIIDLSASGVDSATFAASARQAFHSWKAKTDDALVKQVGFTDIASTEAIFQNLIPGFASKWMQYFLASDPAPLLAATDAKILALNGEKDVQVLPASNTNGIRKALEKRKGNNFEIKILPGLNHLFQQCNTCTIQEYGMLDETFSESAIQEISSWLQQNVLRR